MQIRTDICLSIGKSESLREINLICLFADQCPAFPTYINGQLMRFVYHVKMKSSITPVPLKRYSFALPYNMSIYHWNFTWSLSVVTKHISEIQ